MNRAIVLIDEEISRVEHRKSLIVASMAAANRSADQHRQNIDAKNVELADLRRARDRITKGGG